MDGGAQEHGEPSRVGVPEKVGGGVPVAGRVKDGGSDLGPIEVIVGEAMLRRHAGLHQRFFQRRRPLHRPRLEGDHLLDPLVGLPHQPRVPAHALNLLRARARVKTRVDAGGAAQDAGPRVDDAVLGDEALHGPVRGEVREVVHHGHQVRYVAVAVGGAASFEHEHVGALRQRGGHGAAGSAAADNDVVVVRYRWGPTRMFHERVLSIC